MTSLKVDSTPAQNWVIQDPGHFGLRSYGTQVTLCLGHFGVHVLKSMSITFGSFMCILVGTEWAAIHRCVSVVRRISNTTHHDRRVQHLTPKTTYRISSTPKTSNASTQTKGKRTTFAVTKNKKIEIPKGIISTKVIQCHPI